MRSGRLHGGRASTAILHRGKGSKWSDGPGRIQLRRRVTHDVRRRAAWQAPGRGQCRSRRVTAEDWRRSFPARRPAASTATSATTPHGGGAPTVSDPSEELARDHRDHRLRHRARSTARSTRSSSSSRSKTPRSCSKSARSAARSSAPAAGRSAATTTSCSSRPPGLYTQPALEHDDFDRSLMLSLCVLALRLDVVRYDAWHDPLTGLYDRRSFDRLLEMAIAAATGTAGSSRSSSSTSTTSSRSTTPTATSPATRRSASSASASARCCASVTTRPASAATSSR